MYILQCFGWFETNGVGVGVITAIANLTTQKKNRTVLLAEGGRIQALVQSGTTCSKIIVLL